MNEQELKHYGVKGMKWGVRRGHKAKQYPTKARDAISKQQKLQNERINEFRRNGGRTSTGSKTSAMSKTEKKLYSDYKKYSKKSAKLGDPSKHYSKAFTKSTKELNKRKAKAHKTSQKATKQRIKTNKRLARTSLTDLGRDKERRMMKRAAKAETKAYKAEKRLNKFEKAMKKEFANVSVKDIDQESLDLGREYVYMLMKK